VNQQVTSDETTNTMKTLEVNNFDQLIHHFLHLNGRHIHYWVLNDRLCKTALAICVKKKAFMMELTNILGTFHDSVLNKYIFYTYRNLHTSAFWLKAIFMIKNSLKSVFLGNRG